MTPLKGTCDRADLFDVADPLGSRLLARRTLARLRSRGRAHEALQGDEGFTMAELIVTMIIIAGVLLGLMALQVSAMVATGQSRQRQQGTAVANEVMEELRALPWATLSKGLHTNFVTAAGGDANVSSGRLRPTANSSVDEALVTSSEQVTDAAPLSGTGGINVVTRTDPATPGFVYTARSYVTKTDGETTGLIQLTVIVTWHKIDTPVSSKATVLLRSQAYSPSGGCGATGNQPFLGACQAFLSAEAGAAATATSLSAARNRDGTAPGSTGLLPGSTSAEVTLVGLQASAAMSSMQTSTGTAKVAAGGAVVRAEDGTEDSQGGAAIQADATTDVASVSGGVGHSSTTTAASAGTLNVAGTNSSVLLTPPTGQSRTAQASTDTTTCPGPTPAGQPCADGRYSGGAGGSAVLTVPGQTVTLVSQAASSTASYARVTRFLSSAGSTALGCATISGAGCVSAQASRTFGTITVGKTAWASSAATSGLVEITGYSDSALSEYGTSSLSKTETVTRGGTLKYWNGTSYTSLTLTPSLNATASTPGVSWTNGTSKVSAWASVEVHPYSAVRTNTDTSCATANCSLAVNVTSVTVSVLYEVTDASGTSAFTVTTDLGSVRSASSYKAAPSA